MEQPHRQNYNDDENDREERGRMSMDHGSKTTLIASPSPPLPASLNGENHDDTHHQNHSPIQGKEEQIHRTFPIIGCKSPTKTKSFQIASQDDDVPKLSPEAQVALQSFSDTIKRLDKEIFDEDGFNTFLGDIGYDHDRSTGLFRALLNQIHKATGHPEKNDISVDDMSALYSSEQYRSPIHLIMECVDELLDELNVDRNKGIDRDIARDLMKLLMNREPSNEEVQHLFDELDPDGLGIISCDKMKRYLLKPNKNRDNGTPRNFNCSLLEPTLATSDQFLIELESYARNHRAIKNLVQDLASSACSGKEETVDLLLRSFAACSHLEKGFDSTIQSLLDTLPDKNHKEILQVTFAERNNLHQRVAKALEKLYKRSYIEALPENIKAVNRKVSDDLAADGKTGHLAAVYFGSALIIPELYKRLLQELQHSSGISIHDTMDDDEAQQLREILIANSATREDREKLAKNTERILTALHVELCDELFAQSDFHVPNSSMSASHDDDQVNKQIQSDLKEFDVCRQTVIEMCEDLLVGATVVDVGCGEGYVSRGLKEMGAQKIVGVDKSEALVKAAKSHCDKSSDEYYIEGDARTLKKNLADQSAATNTMLGAQFDIGCFDLAVANCTFDYMTMGGMDKSLEEIKSVLKPGGYFVFSIVLHPSYLSHHDDITKIVSLDTLLGKQFDGCMKTIDGDGSKFPRVYYKNVDDCKNALKIYGFELIASNVARVTPEQFNGEDSAIFNAVNDGPVHLVFKARKPANISTSPAVGNATTFDLLPKKLTWNKTMIENFDHEFVVVLSEDANHELCNAALELHGKGLSVDNIVIGQHVDAAAFKTIKPLCTSIRSKLLHQTGAVIVKGLDMNKLGGEENIEKMEACSKIAFFLLCQHIGIVDGGARGTLFDVKDENIDANDDTVDNVLFSVSSAEAGWHTDGASKDRVYDAVGLLCISPAAHGGEFRISNACNVYDEMMKLPAFLRYEITRPLPRDVLENGRGLGSGKDIVTLLSRSAHILAMRIRYNSYPIYAIEDGRMRFRYMRHWINTGHSKTGWEVPTLLRIAMDILDKKMNESCAYDESLDRGDIVFCNNALVAHARASFKNAPGSPPRHKVRAWLQIQKPDMVKKR